MAEETVKEFRSMIGVKNIHFAPYKDGIWKEPIKVNGLQELSIKNTVAEGSLIGDMRKLKSKSKKTGLEVDLTVAEWTPSIQAMLEGCFNENGELESSPDDVDQAVALLWKEVYDNGDEVYNVVYNTKIHRENAFEGKGNDDKIDFAVTKLVGSGLAVTNPNTGKPTFSLKLDTADEKVDKNKVTNFFTAIQFRGLKPTA
ncbi:major tail protein [Clostridium uliginosum]|uniref:Phage major tail protein, phi13 family n=1 Tax=Clostridium uliginosum TaxID=119641 RepID=A0A1I1H1U9_9CLOT|nr:major tail protein [Clostridium uliginosum]SFC15150.1 phage major tail protein, phi13 family [Clostridium uliginosum]